MFDVHQLLQLFELAYRADPNGAMAELGKLLRDAEVKGKPIAAALLREVMANLADGLPLHVLGHHGQLQRTTEPHSG